MRTAAIAHRHGELKAFEKGDVWTVRLANLEMRARYLDLALAQLLGSAQEAHRAAARLLSELEDLVEQQEVVQTRAAPAPRRESRRARARQVSTKPLVPGLRILACAVVAGTAFMLTTWLSAPR